MSFDSDLDTVLSTLRRRGRASLLAIAAQLGATDDYVRLIRDELVDVLEVAIETDGILSLTQTDGDASVARGAERRQVTFLFCDVVESTPLSSRLDPEDLRDLMIGYQQACGEVIARYDGHISQWIGDGVVVYFGYPDAHDDDAVRAVRAGLDVADAVRSLRPAADGSQLAVRIGVHSGSVIVGDVAGTRRQETLAFGETPNICARIEASARPNTVAISESTQQLVAGFFDVADRGLHELKGAAQPMRVFEVIGTSGVRDRFDVVLTQGVSPLVGRHVEREAIASALERAAAGSATAMVLVGEPGIGKSRLAHHARELMSDEGSCIELHASPLRQASALFPVVRALGTHLGLDTAASDSERLEVISHAVAAARGDDRVAVTLLAELLGAAPPASPAVSRMTPQQRRALLMDVTADLVCAEARTRPLLVVVEDLHWLDPSSREFIELVLAHADDGTHMFVLATTRPDKNQHLPGAVELALGPLGTDDAAELAASVVRGDGVDHDLVQRVVAQSDGVPLFVEELARAVAVARGTAPDGDGVTIPQTLFSCLQARLDRLSGPARTVAQWAAACGRSFDATLIAEVVDVEPPAFAGALAELEEARLVDPRGDGVHFEFRHALIQEAAAGSALRREARNHHDALATALLERPEQEPEVVARHLEDAGRTQTAIEQWQAAGLGALTRSANVEAIAHLRHALELLATMPESNERDEVEAALQVLLAVPLTLTEGWASADVGAAYRRADELCAGLGDTTHLFPTLVGLLTYDIVRAAHVEAHARAEHNHAVAAATGDPELLVEAEHDRGTTLFYLGRTTEALEHLEAVAELFDPVAHEHHVLVYGKNPAAIAAEHAGLAHWLLGRPDEALRQHDVALAHLDDHPHPFTRLWVLTGRSVVHQLRGEVDTVATLSAQIIADATEQGFPNWLAQALVYNGWARTVAGEHTEGLAQIQQGTEIWQMTGAGLLVPYLVWLQADAWRVVGDRVRAMEVLREAADIAEKTSEGWWEPEVWRVLGELEAEEGDLDAGLELVDRALATAQARGAHSLVLRAAVSKVGLLPDGADSAATDLVASALTAIEGGEATPELSRARRLLSRTEGPVPS